MMQEWQNRIVGSGIKPAKEFLANPFNYKIHTALQHRMVEGSLDTLGWVKSVVENIRTGHLIDGHERVSLALRRGEETPVPYEQVDLTEEEEMQALATLDPLIALAGNDSERLEELLSSFNSDDERIQEFLAMLAADNEIGDRDAEKAIADEEARQTLAERFGVPPFSVLDARQGYWQTRKRAWINLGIKSELGRGENLLDLSETVKNEFYGKADAAVFNSGGPGGLGKKYKEGTLFKSLSGRVPDYYYQKQDWENRLGRELTTDEFEANYLQMQEGSSVEASGTSIFDPVLCELAYRWFAPRGGSIFDPFAGGSVRGIVASLLGYEYTGIDLRTEQIEANEKQAAEIAAGRSPRWIAGDSTKAASLAYGEYDLIFSCPPYGNLEVYSDKPEDLSTMDFDQFVEAYREIVRVSVGMLRDDRFACFVVGDFRDKNGFYRNFPALTIQAFQDVGAVLYNEAILVTTAGSLPIRVGRQFSKYRKLGKTHQNVLVFYKGNPKAITNFGDVEFGSADELQGADEIPD